MQINQEELNKARSRMEGWGLDRLKATAADAEAQMNKVFDEGLELRLSSGLGQQ